MGVTAIGEVTTGNEIAEVTLLSREALARWPFGRLAVTSTIVWHCLEATRPDWVR